MVGVKLSSVRSDFCKINGAESFIQHQKPFKIFEV